MAERYRYSTDEVVSIICGDKEVDIEESDCSSEDLACGIELPVALDSETEAVEESYGCFTDSNHESDDEMVVSSPESSPLMKDSSCLSSEDSSVLTEISSESSEESSDSSWDQKTSKNSVSAKGKFSYRARRLGITRSCRGRGRGRGRESTLSPRSSGASDSVTGLPDKAVSIRVKDASFERPVCDEFSPLRDSGPHIPDNFDVTPLSLFEIYFDDEAVERILRCTLAYAESKKEVYPVAYKRFTASPFTKRELLAYLGVLLLQGIHGVRNHRYAWSLKKAQVLVRLDELSSCRYYETVGTFLHLVTPDEEKNMADHKLRKILPYIKSKCSDLYQPLRELSIDERMVKTKARTLFRQYILNKPTTWGMKYWVLADRSGYTGDFNIYAGRSTTYSGNGLSFDVVMELIEPYVFQGYELFIDNFYTSPVLLEKLLEYGIVATGTLIVTRRNVPREVVAMKKAVEKHSVHCGTGYYFRPHDSKITFCVWHDTKTLAMASTAFPGHSENTVVRRVKDSTSGSSISKELPCPIMLTKYNKSMGGMDKSDQYISYHKILRPTVKYWKKMFFHSVDIITVNSHIVYNWYRLKNNSAVLSENQFRDLLILDIIQKYGLQKTKGSRRSSSNTLHCKISHGNTLHPTKARCVYCGLHGKYSLTQRRCSDCHLQPALCQIMERDCHSHWHSKSFMRIRNFGMSMSKTNSANSPNLVDLSSQVSVGVADLEAASTTVADVGTI